MAGQVIKRADRTYLVRIFNGRDENGKRRYINKTIHGTKKDAERCLTAKLRDKHLDINIEPASESLAKYLDKCLETSVKPRVRSRTYDDYVSLMARHVREPLGAIKLCCRTCSSKRLSASKAYYSRPDLKPASLSFD